MKSKKRLLWEYTEAIITALILALLIRAYVIQAFKIPSGSMIPTLVIGDHILVNKFLYGTKIPFSETMVLEFTKPEKGNIIVFKYPEDPTRDFIKRIIAVEGDVVESKNKTIYVNGKQTSEPYTQHTDNSIRPMGIEPRDNFGPLIVPRNKFFVMGDNRDQSYDSRYWGYVDRKDIKGKALILYWSWDSKNNWVRFARIGRLVK
ncbi:MAG: signal peptidase I [Thermodesulfovibrionales bacterium]|nr:signal peptidase I [Thermodesulfovibrionales bacterium]MDP3111854.1 signal peptidase I [Thermodesulfovibrionales bacterium]